MHAGLECGVIGEKYPGMQMVSPAPNCGPPQPQRARADFVGRGVLEVPLKAVLEADIAAGCWFVASGSSDLEEQRGSSGQREVDAGFSAGAFCFLILGPHLIATGVPPTCTLSAFPAVDR